MIDRLVFVPLLLALGASVANAQGPRELKYSTVKRIAELAISNKTVEYTVPKISIDRPNRLVAVAFGNISVPANSPIEKVVAYQIQMEAWRTGYGTALNKDFWEPLIRQAEAVIENQMLRVAYQKNLSVEQKVRILDGIEQQTHGMFRAALACYAGRIGCRLVFKALQHGAWQVAIRTQPEGAEIRMLHLIQWIVAKMENKDPTNDMVPVQEGLPITWSGTYLIAATFPDKRTYGPKRRYLNKDGTLTLYPDREPKFVENAQ